MGQPVDHRECRSSAGAEVGRDFGMMGIHRGVEDRKVHLWDHLYRKPGHHVGEWGRKVGRRYLVGYERTWRSELMVGQMVSRDGEARCSEILDHSEDRERHRYGNLVRGEHPIVHWTKCWALCHCGTPLAGWWEAASHVFLEAESVDGKLARRGVENA